MIVQKVAGISLCLLSFVVIGCEPANDAEEEPATEPAAMPAPAPTENVTTDAGPGAPSVMQLEAKENSGITGEVTTTRSGSDVNVQISVNGLTGGASYPAHIHSGTCAAGGPVAVELTSVSASGTTGASTTTIEASKLPDQAFVQVHDPSGKPVACSDLTVAVTQ